MDLHEVELHDVQLSQSSGITDAQGHNGNRAVLQGTQ
jgi:hypothetical protein